MEKDSADIAQISFYLAKAGVTSETVMDPEAGLASRQALRTERFEVGDAICGVVHFETLTTKTNPPWLDSLNDRLESEGKIEF